MFRKTFYFLIFFVVSILACQKEVVRNFIGFESPASFPIPVYHFSTNAITEDGFLLGKKLFNDPILSGNNQISCASCHIQTAAFSHRDHSVSHGVFDRLGVRNAPPIMNLAWSPSFMWDGGVFDLDLQPIAPITNHAEMDDTLESVLEKVRQNPGYPNMFQKAFGSKEVTSSRFLKALSQFMVMCVSDQSKYDSVQRHQTSFTQTEQDGYEIFQANCASCHKEPLFTDFSFRNNGLRPGPADDAGRYAVTLNENDRYRFKVPSLRNLDYTGPYMHDGRFLTLDAVLDHYVGQVQTSPNLDPLLQKNGQMGIALTTEERGSLLTFLKTLNDRKFVTNPVLTE